LSECELSGSRVLFVSHDQALENACDHSIDLSTLNRADITNQNQQQENVR